MNLVELTERQRQDLERWLREGFSDYAGLCGKGGDHFTADQTFRSEEHLILSGWH